MILSYRSLSAPYTKTRNRLNKLKLRFQVFAASTIVLVFPLLVVSPAHAAVSATFNVVSGPNPSVVGQHVGIMVESNPLPWSGGQPLLPTQSITFYDGTNVIGQGAAVPIFEPGSTYAVVSVINYSFQAVGAHQIYATYPGDANFSAFTTGTYTQTVNATASCPCTNWQTTTNPGLGFYAGIFDSNNTLQIPYGESDFYGDATVAAPQWNIGLNNVAQPTGSVNLAIDGQSFAQVPISYFNAYPNEAGAGPAYIPVEPIGQHSLVASYLGDSTFSNWTFGQSTSQPFTFDIIAGQTRSTLTATSANGQLSLQSSIYPQAKSFFGFGDYCSVAPLTGSVTFMNGSTILTTVPISDGIYGINITTQPYDCHYGLTANVSIPVPPGAYNITAVYNGDGNFQPSTSPAQQVTVQGTPLSITVPQNISVNATGPNGAAVSYSVSTSGGAGSMSVNCDHQSGSTFPIGTTTVTCTAKDSFSDMASGSFTVTVTGALGQTQNLLSAVTGSGPGQSLSSKLTTVEEDLQASPPDTQDACGTLNAFINEVSAQSGKKLDTDTANAYMSAAAQIAYVLGC